MFKRKASLAVESGWAALSMSCVALVGVASCVGAMAAETPAYRYLDENGSTAYSQYPPMGIAVRKIDTTTAMTGHSAGTARPRYGDESRYAAARQDTSPELERRQAKIAAEASENKRAAKVAAECRRNHDIGCRPAR